MSKAIFYRTLALSFMTVAIPAHARKVICNQASSDFVRISDGKDQIAIKVGSSSQSMKKFVESSLGLDVKKYNYFELAWVSPKSNCDVSELSSFVMNCSDDSKTITNITVSASEWRNQRSAPSQFSLTLSSVASELSIDSFEDKAVFMLNASDNQTTSEFTSKFFEYQNWSYDGRRQQPECQDRP